MSVEEFRWIIGSAIQVQHSVLTNDPLTLNHACCRLVHGVGALEFADVLS